MNTQLIADAVRNSRGEGEATVWDRLFAFWFRRLVYTQIWEDPVADLAALRLPLGSTIVTISSGGCNALSYLTAQPAQVYAVDLNEAHLSLLKLKLAGIRAFSEYAEFWRFFGEAASPSNSELYRERLRPMLDAEARILGQAQHLWPSAACLFHRRLLPPRHARPLYRPCPFGGEIRRHRPRGAAEGQAGRARAH
jgi:S-adenosylmethionine-diacylglycerol 3-amino-3-carboxypropyl transferase